MLNLSRRVILLVLVSSIGVAVVSGCHRSNDLRPISGKVTLDGQPAAGAIISFQAAAGSPGNSSGGVVDEQGKYFIPGDKGLKAGLYDVTIQYWKETGETYKDPCSGQTIATTAPVKFAQQGKLQVDVKSNEDGPFDFALTSARR